MTTNQPIISPVLPPPPIAAPANPNAPFAPPAPPPPATRYRLKYGVLECMTCGLAKEYCKGHAPPPPPQGDGVSSDLIARIREAQGGR